MTWNPITRRYEDANGNPVDPARIREDLDEFIDAAQNEIDDQSHELLIGAITVAAFFAFLGGLITSMHIASSLIAYGGESEMNPERWGRVDERLSGEIAYLEAFQEQVNEAETVTQALAEFIANSTASEDTAQVVHAIAEAVQTEGRADLVATVGDVLESVGVTDPPLEIGTLVDSFGDRIGSLIWGEIPSRSRSYADGAFATYENSVKSRESDAGAAGVAYVCENDASSCEDCVSFDTDGEYVSFEEVADIGSGSCQNNCRCSYVFEYANIGPLYVDEELYA